MPSCLLLTTTSQVVIVVILVLQITLGCPQFDLKRTDGGVHFRSELAPLLCGLQIAEVACSPPVDFLYALQARMGARQKQAALAWSRHDTRDFTLTFLLAIMYVSASLPVLNRVGDPRLRAEFKLPWLGEAANDRLWPGE